MAAHTPFMFGTVDFAVAHSYQLDCSYCCWMICLVWCSDTVHILRDCVAYREIFIQVEDTMLLHDAEFSELAQERSLVLGRLGFDVLVIEIM